MRIKEIFKVVLSIVMAVFIIAVSMGLNISKMNCSEDNTLYFGTEVPSCSEETEVVCEKEQEKVSCCLMEIEKTCCPETNDNSCESETENIHFNFETFISSECFNFEISPILISFLSYNIFSENTYSEIKHFSGIPPPKLNQPELSKIQSFLL